MAGKKGELTASVNNLKISR